MSNDISCRNGAIYGHKNRKKDINNSLNDNIRQYLVNNLESPQQLKHIQDENVEVSMSSYKSFTSDKPHFHERLTEYQVVLDGYSEIVDVYTKEITSLNKDDFFIVDKGTKYAQKSSSGTKLLFFKYSDGNNKRAIEVDNDILSWLNKEI